MNNKNRLEVIIINPQSCKGKQQSHEKDNIWFKIEDGCDRYLHKQSNRSGISEMSPQNKGDYEYQYAVQNVKN